MILVLVGPTAAGKSALAVRLAESLRERGTPAEVVSADSMLLYRGMDVGTAKPTVEERAGIPHHLIDVLDVTQAATVAEFQALARAAIGNGLRRQALPIVVGGSALYVRAVVDRFEFPGTDPVRRAAWEARLAAEGPEALHRELTARDPAAAAVIAPRNGRRVVRALEVVELTGRPYAATLPERRYALPGVVQLGLDVDRATLDERIENRVRWMWRDGLVEEVRRLEAAGLREGRTASRALGYRQVLEFLDGRMSEVEAFEQTVRATRRFARRQDSWFRRDDRIRWLRHDRPDLVGAALAAAGLDGEAPVED